jgi:hypothetical protein
MKRLVVVLILGFALGSALGRPFRTWGSPDCKEWMTPADPSTVRSRQGWLLGFLTGLNAAYSEVVPKGDPLTQLQSAEQAFRYLDNYCKAHPMEDATDGASALFSDLRARADARK